MNQNLVGETSELWEAFRKSTLDKPCDKTEGMEALTGETLTNMEEEVADIVIRALDLAAKFGVDISKAVRVKHAYNRSRGFRHGGKIALFQVLSQVLRAIWIVLKMTDRAVAPITEKAPNLLGSVAVVNG